MTSEKNWVSKYFVAYKESTSGSESLSSPNPTGNNDELIFEKLRPDINFYWRSHVVRSGFTGASYLKFEKYVISLLEENGIEINQKSFPVVVTKLADEANKAFLERKSVTPRIDCSSRDYASFQSFSDYEKQCANELSRYGWNCRTTKGSNDQGVDVIGTRNSEKLVVQCKLHNRLVGNKAVQEALAEKAYYGATKAAVSAENGFTKSAQDLAIKTEVYLVNIGKLRDL